MYLEEIYLSERAVEEECNPASIPSSLFAARSRIHGRQIRRVPLKRSWRSVVELDHVAKLSETDMKRSNLL
jgi:hypothetical protein